MGSNALAFRTHHLPCVHVDKQVNGVGAVQVRIVDRQTSVARNAEVEDHHLAGGGAHANVGNVRIGVAGQVARLEQLAVHEDVQGAVGPVVIHVVTVEIAAVNPGTLGCTSVEHLTDRDPGDCRQIRNRRRCGLHADRRPVDRGDDLGRSLSAENRRNQNRNHERRQGLQTDTLLHRNLQLPPWLAQTTQLGQKTRKGLRRTH